MFKTTIFSSNVTLSFFTLNIITIIFNKSFDRPFSFFIYFPLPIIIVFGIVIPMPYVFYMRSSIAYTNSIIFDVSYIFLKNNNFKDNTLPPSICLRETFPFSMFSIYTTSYSTLSLFIELFFIFLSPLSRSQAFTTFNLFRPFFSPSSSIWMTVRSFSVCRLLLSFFLQSSICATCQNFIHYTHLRYNNENFTSFYSTNIPWKLLVISHDHSFFSSNISKKGKDSKLACSICEQDDKIDNDGEEEDINLSKIIHYQITDNGGSVVYTSWWL